MHLELKIFLIFCGLCFVFTVANLLLKKKISEWNVIAWGFGALVILLISANPMWVDWAAKRLGIDYPPSLLFMISTLVLLVLVLYQSMQISALQSKLRQIAQHVSLQQYLNQPNQETPAQQMIVEAAAASEAEPEPEGESRPESNS
ncbi:DUF2304 domain-containing protein [Tumebacillus flagellatus]|uniref:DUF2304 domain-containing protein n=1 Tax=Tumebacillus flagellatus TaxID=1157490 RepID=A0A074LLM4_9BACL|nr:DUF2304 domain-containing protein [Tumebacillus flagellatus]KEO81460.1 hypothetical protein EL26_20505 [Tumebacillus flagellatus]